MATASFHSRGRSLKRYNYRQLLPPLRKTPGWMQARACSRSLLSLSRPSQKRFSRLPFPIKPTLPKWFTHALMRAVDSHIETWLRSCAYYTGFFAMNLLWEQKLLRNCMRPLFTSCAFQTCLLQQRDDVVELFIRQFARQLRILESSKHREKSSTVNEESSSMLVWSGADLRDFSSDLLHFKRFLLSCMDNV